MQNRPPEPALSDDPIRDQQVRLAVEQRDELIREVRRVIPEFLERMKDIGYPGARIYTFAKPTHHRLLLIHWTTFEPVDVPGWSIGYGHILLEDGSIAEVNNDVPNNRWNLKEVQDPFHLDCSSTLRSLATWLREHPYT